MQEIWTILGLDGPPENAKALKRAYAAKLKITRPEDDPDGFMALREAFAAGQEWVSMEADCRSETLPGHPISEEKSNEYIIEENVAPKSGMGETALPFACDTAKAGPQLTPLESPAEAIIQRIQNILKSPTKRNDKESWRLLLSDPSIDAVDDWVEFDWRLRRYLLDKFGAYDGNMNKQNRYREPRLISQDVGRFIFTRMDWHNLEGRDAGVVSELEWLEDDFDAYPLREFNNYDNPKNRLRDIDWKEHLTVGNIFWGVLIFIFIMNFIIEVIKRATL